MAHETPEARIARRSGARSSGRESADLFWTDLMGRPPAPRRPTVRRMPVAAESSIPIDSIEPECGCHGGRAEPEEEIATEAMVSAFAIPETVHAETADNAPLVTRCGFFGPNVQRSVQEVRAAVVAAANAEWTRWHTSAGAPRVESDVALFGDLVRYYLAAISAIRPDTLTAIQAAAVAATTSYGSLPTAGSNAATVTSEAARVRGVLLTGAPGAGSPANLATLVEQALAHARQAHLDSGAHSAWSSVWVSHCVRKAAIDLGLEAMIQGNHSGRDELLRVSGAHRVYALEAHRRRVGPNRRDGTYHAFAPTSRAPAVGDIIVQDRQANAVAQVLSYADIGVLAQGRKTHGDIVIEVATGHVVTIGGNLGQGVRKRRFPLDGSGRLVVASNQLYTQEDSAGALAAVPSTTTAALASTSTRRIFALLSPVEVCAAVPGQPYGGGVLV